MLLNLQPIREDLRTVSLNGNIDCEIALESDSADCTLKRHRLIALV